MSDILKEITEKVNSAPLLSLSALELIKLLQDPNRTADNLCNVIIKDASLTSEVLRLVNSSQYALRNPVDNVKRALVFLGDKEIFSIAIRATTSSIYNCPLPFYETEKGDLWNHSLRMACCARLVVKRFAPDTLNQETAFTAGIMASIGKTIIGHFLNRHREYIINSLDKMDNSFLRTEDKLLGTDHAKIGYMLAQKWKIPNNLCEIIKNYLTPNNAPEDVQAYAYTVHLANHIAMLNGRYTGIDAFKYELDEGYKEFFPVKIADVEKLELEIEDEVETMKVSS